MQYKENLQEIEAIQRKTAKIPQEHFKTIEKIEYTNCQFETNDKVTEVRGLHCTDGKKSTIFLSRTPQSMNKTPRTPDGLADTLLHEIGHNYLSNVMDDELKVHFMRVHSAIEAHIGDLKVKIDFEDITLDRFEEFFADLYRINVNDCGKLMDIDDKLRTLGDFPSLTDLFDKAFYGR